MTDLKPEAADAEVACQMAAANIAKHLGGELGIPYAVIGPRVLALLRDEAQRLVNDQPTATDEVQQLRRLLPAEDAGVDRG